MKRSFTILFLIAAAFGMVSAQVTFHVSATQVWKVTNPNEPDIEGHFEITNATGSTQTIKWERTTINITNGCLTQVCDLNLCYTPVVSSKNFDIAANATGNIIMHFLNYDSLPNTSGVIHLKMTNVNFPTDTVTVVFLFTEASSGTNQALPAPTVKLFPNPATDYFRLDRADAVQRIRMFALDNREVARYTAAPGMTYPLTEVPAGTYILALEDENGRVFQALELIKK